jgi:putative MATE family efflux protein
MDPLKGKPHTVFFGYALPSIVGMLAISSATIIDGLFVGNYVGSDALAAVNLSMPLLNFVFGFSFMLAIGGSVMAGKFLGEKNTAAASAIFSRVLLVQVGLGLLALGLGLLFLDGLIFLLGADQGVQPLVAEYLVILLWAMPVFSVGIAIEYFVRVDGRPVLAGTAFVIEAAVNVGLDWLFIAKLDYGLTGAAWATAIAYSVAIVVMVPHFFSDKAKLAWNLAVGHWSDVRRAAFNGASDFANEVSAGITALIFNWVMMSRYGVDGVAAFAIVNYIMFSGVIFAFAIGDSLQPMVSQCFGARDAMRIKQFMRIGISTVIVTGLAVVALLVTAPTLMIDMFLDENSAVTERIAGDFITLFWPAFLFNGVTICLAAYATAMHKPIPSAVIALARSLVFPGLFLLTLPLWFGDKGVFLAIPAAEFVAFFLAIHIYRKNSPERLVALAA